MAVAVRLEKTWHTLDKEGKICQIYYGRRSERGMQTGKFLQAIRDADIRDSVDIWNKKHAEHKATIERRIQILKTWIPGTLRR